METSPKLGFTFHRTFTLSRDMLRQVVSSTVTRNNLSKEMLYKETSLGKEQVDAFGRYAVGCGLVKLDKSPSLFGQLSYERDPSLVLPASQWLMHYHLVAPHRCGPSYWQHLVKTQLLAGNVLTRQLIVQELERFVQMEAPKPDALRSTATVFLGSYAKTDGLAGIGVFTPTEKLSLEQSLIVQEVEPPSPEAFSYIFADYWDGVWSNRKDVAVREVTAELGPLLMLDSGVINACLNQLQDKGLIEVHRKIPPHNVTRLWEDSAVLLRQVYA